MLSAGVLSIATGAALLISSIVWATLSAPLPFSGEAQRLYEVQLASSAGEGGNPLQVPYALGRAWRNGANSVEALAAFAIDFPLNSSSDGAAHVPGAVVESALFDLLGTKPFIGRSFDAGDGEVGRPAVVIISHRLWLTKFGADVAAIGRNLVLDGESHQIIGVMPPSFHFPLVSADLRRRDPVIWRPLRLIQPRDDDRSLWFVARLRAHASLATAAGEMRVISDAIVSNSPRSGVILRPVRDNAARNVIQSLRVARISTTLLVGIALVSTLMLWISELVETRPDRLIRTALGASQASLFRDCFRQRLVEGVIGIVAGGGLAISGGLAFKGAIEQTLPPYVELRVSLIVVLAVFGGALLGVSLLSAVAAWYAARGLPQAASVLTSGTQRGSAPRRVGGVFEICAAVQMALAVTLIVAGTGVTRSLLQLVAPRGFDATDVSLVEVFVTSLGYTNAQLAALADRLQTIRHLVPGVEQLSISSGVPFAIDAIEDVRIANPRGHRTLAGVQVTSVTPEYFDVLRIPIKWRLGAVKDKSPLYVDELLARYIPGLPESSETTVKLEGLTAKSPDAVIGSTRDLIRAASAPRAYVAFRQRPSPLIRVLLRMAPGVAASERSIRDAIRAVAPEVPVDRVVPLGQLLLQSLARERLTTILAVILAIVASLTATLAVYGATQYAAAIRRREFAIRSALGATAPTLALAFLRSLALLIGFGGLVGVGMSLLISGAMAHIWQELRPIRVIDVVPALAFCGAVGLVAALGLLRAVFTLEPSRHLSTD